MHERELIEHQRYVELTYSKRSRKNIILNDLRSEPQIGQIIAQCAQELKKWSRGDYYPSKMKRLSELHTANFEEVIEDILTVTVTCTEPTEYISVIGQTVKALSMSDRTEAIQTVAEILAKMFEFGFFTLFREDPEDKRSCIMLQTCIELEERTYERLSQLQYLPPMVVEPNEVTKNYDGALLTEKSSHILGKQTHHSGDICLDSINKFNRVPLSLNQRLLTQLSEKPKEDWAVDTRLQWQEYAIQSYTIYRELIQLGNRFWLTHKVDKRGRTYSQGYHVNSQGNKFRKAMVEFADKEVIN